MMGKKKREKKDQALGTKEYKKKNIKKTKEEKTCRTERFVRKQKRRIKVVNVYAISG